jgi:hypothetical protein
LPLISNNLSETMLLLAMIEEVETTRRFHASMQSWSAACGKEDARCGYVSFSNENGYRGSIP